MSDRLFWLPPPIRVRYCSESLYVSIRDSREFPNNRTLWDSCAHKVKKLLAVVAAGEVITGKEFCFGRNRFFGGFDYATLLKGD